jgi:predicted O-methyltransferase YrrM
MEPQMSTSVFDNGYRTERERLASLEALFDPGTVRVLGGLGVGPGWRCLEVGAGGGSVAAWLGERVRPSGRVLATDLVRFRTILADPTFAATSPLMMATWGRRAA